MYKLHVFSLVFYYFFVRLFGGASPFIPPLNTPLVYSIQQLCGG